MNSRFLLFADPHIATIIKDFATAAAIIIGGGWALWKWGFEEYRKSKREISSLDGKMSALDTSLNDENSLITIDVFWNNTGAVPVKLNTETSSIEVFEINKDKKLGFFEPGNDLKRVYEVKPLEDYSEYVLEPKTNSLMQANIILDKSESYLIRWTIYENEPQKPDDAYFWHRDLIWRSAEPIADSKKALTGENELSATMPKLLDKPAKEKRRLKAINEP